MTCQRNPFYWSSKHLLLRPFCFIMAWMYPGSTAYGSGFHENSTRNGCLGSFLCIPRLTIPKILLLLVSGVQLSVAGAVIVLYFHHNIPGNVSLDASFITNICMLILLVSSFFLVIWGVCLERVNEVCLCLVTLTLLTIYSVMDYYMSCANQSSLRNANTYTLGIGTPMVALLTRWTTSFFPNQRIIGAADSLRYMYEGRNNLLCVMRLDLLITLILAIMSYSLNDHEQHLGYFTACVILIVACLKWIMGRASVIKEIKAMVYVYVTLSTLSQLWVPIQVS